MTIQEQTSQKNTYYSFSILYSALLVPEMTKIMKIDDVSRIRVLEGMLGKGAVSPSLNRLQQKTKLHKATVKASIEFLKKEGILDGFGPKVNFRKFGYGLEVISLLQVDLSETAVFAILTFWHPFAAIFFARRRKFSGSGSKANTLPSLPTIFEAIRVYHPRLAPMSIKVMPSLRIERRSSVSNVSTKESFLRYSTTILSSVLA